MAMIFRRPDGRLVRVAPGDAIPVLEEQPADFGRLLMELNAGRLVPVNLSLADASDALVRQFPGPCPVPGPHPRGPQRAAS